MAAINKRFARHPSCFGKLDCRGLCDVARKNGMKIISACKSDMHAFNDIGLYGTSAQMKQTEREWTAAGNKLKPPSFKSVFRVNLDIPEEDWADTVLEWFRAHAVAVGPDGWECPLSHGAGKTTAPREYRKLRKSELPTADDIAWHAGLGLWAPVRQKDLEYCGASGYLSTAYCVLRKKK